MSLFKRQFFIWMYYKDGKGMEGYKTALFTYGLFENTRKHAMAKAVDKMIQELKEINNNTPLVITNIKIF